jgi:hypothetical protein
MISSCSHDNAHYATRECRSIGNRARDLPTCSAVPQPTAPPRTPRDYYSSYIFMEVLTNL